MNNNTSNTSYYTLTYILGFLVSKFFNLLWTGVVTASQRYKPLLIANISLFSLTFLSFVAFEDCTFMSVFVLITSILFGLFVKADEYPHKQMVKNFNEIFAQVDLKSHDNSYPYFLYEKTISNYAKYFAFKTLIPLVTWNTKKDTLEMYFNAKIIDITQDEQDNRTIYVIVQTEPLPDFIAWEDSFIDNTSDILNIGIGYYGLAALNLRINPHAFIAGETGSGKSNVLKCLIYQSLRKEYDVILIDFKRGVSFTNFSDVVKVVYEYDSAKSLLESMVKETKRRLDLFRNLRVDNIIDYNGISDNYLSRKIIYIDELAELLKIRDKEISNSLYDSIETLTRLSRAVGIHLIMGIQRPDSTIINGQIKNNVSFRLCGRFIDKEPSRIMLGSDEASKIDNIKGRFLIKDDEIKEIQSFYYIDNCQIKKQNPEHVENLSLPPNKSECDEVIHANVKNELNFDFSDINPK